MAHSHEQNRQHSCPACNYGPFTRNNYFTGKLLVERDFTDETRFHMEKLRHHRAATARLGRGLRAQSQAASESKPAAIVLSALSQDRRWIAAATTSSCARKSALTLRSLPAIKALQSKNDKEPHTLQICVRFRECPTEEIPVLYDDCGCDDTKCAPNRILESYEIDVIVDPPDEPDSFHTPKLSWENSIAIAHAAAAVLHDASHRLYVLTADDPATVYQISTDNHATITSRTLPAKVSRWRSRTMGSISTSSSNRSLRPRCGNCTCWIRRSRACPISIRIRLICPIVRAATWRWPSRRTVACSRWSHPAAMCCAGRLTLTRTAAPAAPDDRQESWRERGRIDAEQRRQAGFRRWDREIRFRRSTCRRQRLLPSTVLPAAAKPSSMALVSSTAPDMLAVADQTNMLLHLVAAAAVGNA